MENNRKVREKLKSTKREKSCATICLFLLSELILYIAISDSSEERIRISNLSVCLCCANDKHDYCSFVYANSI